ncbi:T9SS type A sorting domain-containing protein [Chryseobacterium arachidis]
MLGFASAFGQAALPYYDGFAYSGTALQTQTGWAALNSGDDIAIVPGNLSYTGLQASTGNKISFAGAGIDTTLSVAAQNSGTVYYSMLVNPVSMAGVTDANGGYFAGLIQGAPAGNVFGGTLWTKRVDDNTLQFGIDVRSNTGAATTWTSTTYSTGQTYLIVVGYTFNTGGTNDDIVSLWVNPATGGSTPPTPTITDTNSTTDLTGINNFLLRQDSATETPSLEIDELRIGTTWASVTPSATSLAVGDLSTIKTGSFVKNTFVKTNEITFGAEAKDVKVYNMFGQIVKTASVKENESVSVAELAKGNYIVTGTVNNKPVSQKILKD